MMSIKLLFILLFVSFIATAFASHVFSVQPAAVAVPDYEGLSCDEARVLIGQKRTVENTLTRQQNNAVLLNTADVFPVLLPLVSVFGANKTGELTIAMVEVNTLERKITASC